MSGVEMEKRLSLGLRTRDEMKHVHVYLWNKNLKMLQKQSAKTPVSGTVREKGIDDAGERTLIST